jgi:hypothetical protein
MIIVDNVKASLSLSGEKTGCNAVKIPEINTLTHTHTFVFF